MTDPGAPRQTLEPPRNEGPGGYIGPFKILQQIGEGGFGAVFEAEQSRPVKRRVALKVIKLGMDTREVIARFEAERQALALMDHPHIARVLDAGATDSGRPYFVMELVKGEPISSYSDKHSLSIVERLRLFEQVCAAVQHAHTKGVIHRDLKPSNVLVSEQDGKPFAKVIDFGIAKATSGRLTDRTLFTELHQMVGTPLYMSPEQAEGSADIDTRTDVYSLGVLLYELLTGSTPFESDTLRAAAYAEVQRIICEVDPPRPSARLSSSSDTLSNVATARGIEPRKLAKLVRGELDWIVMKAIEKERTRRYETANGLAMDLHRYLSGQPVVAAPPSTVYRAKKFIRRHRSGVAAGLLVAASLIAGIVGFAWQARIANLRAAELVQVSEFQADMLGQVDPTRAGHLLSQDVKAMFEESITKAGIQKSDHTRQVETFENVWQQVNATDAARNLIDRTILKPAAQAIDKQFKDQPLVDAALRQVLADRYSTMGLYDAALPLQERALQTRRRVLGDEHPDTLKSITHMGELLEGESKTDLAEKYYREAVAKSRRALGNESPITLDAMRDLGNLLDEHNKVSEAEQLLREVLQTSRRVLGEDHRDTLIAVTSMGVLRQIEAKFSEAEAFFREDLEKSRRILGDDDPETIRSISNMSSVLQSEGKLSEAEPLAREVAEKSRRLLGNENPDTLGAIVDLGVLLAQEGKLSEAEPLLRDALEKCRRVLGEEHWNTLNAMGGLVSLLIDKGEPSAAEPLVREGLAKRRRMLGEDHAATLILISSMGNLLDAEGRFSEAEPFYREAQERYRRVMGVEHPNTLISLTNLGGVLTAQGKHSEAIALLTPAEAAIRKAFNAEEVYRTAKLLMYLGEAHTGLRQYDTAEKRLLEAHEIFVKFPGPAPRNMRACTRAVVELYTAWNTEAPGNGYDARASEWKRKLDALASVQ